MNKLRLAGIPLILSIAVGLASCTTTPPVIQEPPAKTAPVKTKKPTPATKTSSTTPTTRSSTVTPPNAVPLAEIPISATEEAVQAVVEPATPTPIPVVVDTVLKDNPESAPIKAEPNTPSAELPPAVSEETAATATSTPEAKLTPVALSGSMGINFLSRSNPEEEDEYRVNLKVGGEIGISGTINRHPRIESKYLGVEKRENGLSYNLKLTNERGTYAVWSGHTLINKAGEYRMATDVPLLSMRAGGEDRPFAGKIVGRGSAQQGLLKSKLLGLFKKAEAQGKKADPMYFESFQIPVAVPSGIVNVIVNGTFNYDYDTESWRAEKLFFSFPRKGGQSSEELVGTIYWNKADAPGVGAYNLKLIWKEPSLAADESSAFENPDEGNEAAFFADDSAQRTITGSITYRDTLSPEDNETVLSSAVDYAVKFENLPLSHALAFTQMWLMMVGPVNDE